MSTTPRTTPDVDLAIVGGGLVGASLAVALSGKGFRVLLIEAAQPPAIAPQWDERCIALNARSQHIVQQLGLWPLLQAEAVAITATHISERGRFGMAQFTAAEAGLEALGHNLPLRHIGQTVWQAAQQAEGVQIRAPAAVTAVTASDQGVELRLADGQTVHARLLAAADGAQSVVRRALNIAAELHDYRQSAIVTAIRVQRPRAGVAYERFTPDGPIAVLPKPGDACSLIWTLPTAAAERAMALADEVFLAEAAACFGGRLGQWTALGRRQCYPLLRTVSTRLSAPSTMFVGNAAHALHPVAAQGFNLGLRDVAALAELLQACPLAQWADVPARYAAARTQDAERTAGFTHSLVGLFSNRWPGLASARHLGLLGLNLLPGLKREVMWQNLGYGRQA